MLKTIRTLGAVLALAIMATPALAAPEVGQIAPDFEAVDVISGETFKLSDLKGETVVLEWTNHECPFVIKHYDTGNMQKSQQAARDKGVRWLSIVSSGQGRQGFTTPQRAVEVIQEQGAAPSKKVLDPSGDVGHLYGARTTPHMFVVDAEGKLAYAGAIDDNSSPRLSAVKGAKNYVLAALDDIAAGNAVQVSSTQPYGCSVKYAK